MVDRIPDTCTVVSACVCRRLSSATATAAVLNCCHSWKVGGEICAHVQHQSAISKTFGQGKLVQLTSPDDHTQHLIICTVVSPDLQMLLSADCASVASTDGNVKSLSSVKDGFLTLQQYLCSCHLHKSCGRLNVYVSRQICKLNLCQLQICHVDSFPK